MRLYVETNFLLELVYGQEQQADVEALLRLVEAGQASLHLPVFAVAEAMSTATRRAVDRRVVLGAVQKERATLGRSSARGSVVESLNAAAAQLAGVNDDERHRLTDVVSRVLRAAAVLPLDASVDAQADPYRTAFGLTSPDAFVLASITADLRRLPPDPPGRRLSLSRDQRAFDKQLIDDELTSVVCDYIDGFHGGLRRVRALLGLTGPA